MTAPLLDREEYVEQAYFFRVYRERIEERLPAQEVLASIHEELLATTKLPVVVEFLTGEILLHGRISEGMQKLPHYFTPFQCFVMRQAEAEEMKFDTRMGLRVLEREAEYRAEGATQQGLFLYQFECLARNRLGYDRGLAAIAEDGFYDDTWRKWILWIRRQLGTSDFAELVYTHSQQRLEDLRRRAVQTDTLEQMTILFGLQEGRIAKAHQGKDPLYMFAALQRHLDYPGVPRPEPSRGKPLFDPPVELRFQRLENRLALIESELKGGIDLSKFYQSPSNKDSSSGAS